MRKKALIAAVLLSSSVCVLFFFIRKDTALYSFDDVCACKCIAPPCMPDRCFKFGMVGEPLPEELRDFDMLYGPEILAMETLMSSHQYQRAKAKSMPDGGVVMEYWGGCLMYRTMGYWDGTYIWFPNGDEEWLAYTPSEGFATELSDVLKTYGNIIL